MNEEVEEEGMDVMAPEEHAGFPLEVHEYVMVHEVTGAVVELLMGGDCEGTTSSTF